ncbi:uncharacterized protein LOC108107230 [Drosophila eugracilis]|uniref:uncharacterized protein LOC108107230 n=1 Tax=Drosophila eugracilis TaxID=29029 RepID=UPI001BDAE4BC|nr:uncharacterized protein LOC108107230 [Drosophila eugracilis]
MPADIVTTEQLRYQLAFSHAMERTTRHWQETFSWYPRMQCCHYQRIDQIYLESRQRYGDKHFLDYANRKRLLKKYMVTARDVTDTLEERRTLENDGIVGIRVAATENGEYGRMKPASIYFC